MTTLSICSEPRRAFALALALLATACQTAPTVTSDSAPGAKVEAYKTFGFIEAPSTDAASYTTLTTRYFKEAITREMVARGYEFSNEPELLVNFDAAIAGQEKRTGSGVSVGMGGGSGGMRAAGVGVNLGNVFGGKGVESVLAIDVVDRQQKQMVWGGTVTQRVPGDQKEYSQAMIDKAVADIFAKYPKPVVGAAQGTTQQPPG